MKFCEAVGADSGLVTPSLFRVFCVFHGSQKITNHKSWSVAVEVMGEQFEVSTGKFEVDGSLEGEVF